VRTRVLVERERELAALLAAAADARRGRGGVVTLSGEPGIGKTRLAEEAAAEARSAEMLVAWGRAWEAGASPAFWPFTQIARTLRRAGVELPPELAPLLPELRPGAPASDDRFALYDAVLRVIEDAAEERPLYLVLDDLHAADEATVSLAGFLAPNLADLRVLLVVTFRDVEARLSPGRLDALVALGRAGQALRPGRLSRAGVARLVQAEGSPHLGDDAVERLHRASEGNPLFVGELLHVAAASPATAAADEIPDGVRAAIRAHLGQLPGDMRAMLEVAAVLGPELPATTLAEVIDPSPSVEALVARLAEARDLGVLVEPSPSRFAFSHGLFREVLSADLGARRAPLHRRAADVLERLHAGEPTAPLAEIARHLRAAGPEMAARARDAAVAAADRAAATLAHEEAVALREHALAAHELAQPADARRRADLLIALAEDQMRAGRSVDGAATCARAAALARDLGDAERLARAALARGAMLQPGRVDAELVALLDEAVARLRERPADPHHLRARLVARLASARQPARDPSGPVALAREAIALLPADADPQTRLLVLHDAMGALMDIADPRERLPLNEEAARLAAELGARGMLLRTRLRLFFDDADLGNLRAADARLGAVELLVRESPRRASMLSLTLGRCLLAAARAQWAEHERLFDEAQELADDGPVPTPIIPHAVGALRLRGRDDELARRREEVVPTFAHWSSYPAAFDAMLAARQGDRAGAAQALARLDPEHVRICMDTILLAWIAEGAAVARDAAMGALLETALSAHAEEWSSVSAPGFLVETPVAWSRALAASARGRPGDAAAFRRAAFEAARRAGSDAALASMARGLPTIDWGQDAGAAAEGPRERERTASPEVPAVQFRREGEVWRVTWGTAALVLRPSRGLGMLAELASTPGRELYALDLDRAAPRGGTGDGAEVVDAGDSGELLDEQARAAYRARLGELEGELAEAQSWNDAGRTARLRAEAEALRAELARAVGLGGRARRGGGAAERARINVQRRLADAIRHIARQHPDLGRHLDRAVRTGLHCSYQPDRSLR
jgi:hypothetical protein